MIEVNAAQLEKIEMILSGVPGGAEKAIKSVISRVQSTMRTTAVKGITKVYDIKQADVTDKKNTNIKLKRTNDTDGVVGSVIFSGNKIPLYRFGISHKAPKRKPRKALINFGGRRAWVNPGVPVRARLLKSSTKKLFANSFIAKKRNGHYSMFERMGLASQPIREIPGASTAEMAERDEILDKIEAAAMDTIDKRVEHEITRILNGHGMR